MRQGGGTDALRPEARLYWLLWSTCHDNYETHTPYSITTSRTSGTHWPHRVRVDELGSPTNTLDCSHDILGSHRHCECMSSTEFRHFSIDAALVQYAIYMATVDYMIAAYGPYSASATGGNAFARDFLAGVAAMYSTPCTPISSFPLARSTLTYMTTSLREHWASIRVGMANDHFGYHWSIGCDTCVRFLLERTGNPGKVQVCVDAGE